VLVVLAGLGFALSARIVTQYERGVLFRLGRVAGVREPGLTFIVPLIDVLRRVSLRIVTMPIQSQGIITRDNVSVDVSAVAYYRVVDPVKAVVAIENVAAAINQIAQTTLRKVVGQHSLDETLAQTDVINVSIRKILDVQTEDWGVVVTLVGRRRRVAGRGRARRRVRHHDGPSARPAAPQPPEPGGDRRRQEHHGGVPGPAHEHHRSAQRVPDPGAGGGHHSGQYAQHARRVRVARVRRVSA